MSNSLLLAPAESHNPGPEGYSITVTLNAAEGGATLTGTGGCLFQDAEQSLPPAVLFSTYENDQAKVTIFNNMSRQWLPTSAPAR